MLDQVKLPIKHSERRVESLSVFLPALTVCGASVGQMASVHFSGEVTALRLSCVKLLIVQ